MSQKSRNFKIALCLSAITQIGISALVPVFIFTGGALWLQKRFDMGNLIVVCGIVFGACSGFVCMMRQIRAFFTKTK